jgi:hypothetical protein
LRLIVALQLSGGWQHNHSTKARQKDRAKEQSIYSMSMIFPLFLSMKTKAANNSSRTLELMRYRKSDWMSQVQAIIYLFLLSHYSL